MTMHRHHSRALAPAASITHTEFERARQAMLVEFRRLLENGTVAGLSDAVEMAGDTQRVMLQLATLLCDPAA